MLYERKKYPDDTTVTLQGIGHVVGTPSGEIKPGDVLMWNFGSTSRVVSINKETKSYLFVTLESDDRERERMIKKTRLVCILKKVDIETVKKWDKQLKQAANAGAKFHKQVESILNQK